MIGCPAVSWFPAVEERAAAKKKRQHTLYLITAWDAMSAFHTKNLPIKSEMKYETNCLL
jgi:hypothetical protein